MILRSSTVAVAVAISLPATTITAETQWRVGANLASIHVAPKQEFNQFNPGAFVSITYGAGKRFEYGLQAGGYLNSYNERTLYVSSFANWRVASLGSVDIRAGGFLGFFEYPIIAGRAQDFGWPTIGDYILALGPSLKLRLENGVDFTIGYLPASSLKKANGVFTFQASIPFGRQH